MLCRCMFAPQRFFSGSAYAYGNKRVSFESRCWPAGSSDVGSESAGREAFPAVRLRSLGACVRVGEAVILVPSFQRHALEE